MANKKRRRKQGTVYPHGKYLWISFYLPDGTRIQKSSKTTDWEAAEHLLNEELVAVGRGETEALKPWTFGETALDWLRDEIEPGVEHRERTINYWKGIVTNHLMPVFELTTFHELQKNPTMLRNYVIAKQKGISPRTNKPLPVKGKAHTKLSAETILAHITVIGLIFSYARRHNRMTASTEPMEQIKRPKRTFRETVKALEKEQTIAIQAAMSKAEDKRLTAIMLHLGLRIGEALGLYVTDWNSARRELNIRRTVRVDKQGRVYIDPLEDKTKTDAGERDLKVSATVAGWIDDQIAEMRSKGRILKQGDGFIFPNMKGKVKNPNNWRYRVWLPAIEDAQVWAKGQPKSKRPTPHWLRHTYASRLIEDGVDPATIAHLMGHADASITMRIYTHIFERQKAVIADTARLYSAEELAELEI